MVSACDADTMFYRLTLMTETVVYNFVLMNKLVPCAWLATAALDVWRLQLELRVIYIAMVTVVA